MTPQQKRQAGERQQPVRAPKGDPVTVRANGAWVCPVTDHANHHDLAVCGRCKAPLVDGRVECGAA